jgi:hypothetical protein
MSLCARQQLKSICESVGEFSALTRNLVKSALKLWGSRVAGGFSRSSVEN